MNPIERVDWICDMVRLAKMAAEQYGDEFRPTGYGPYGHESQLIYQDGVVLIYLHHSALTIYDQTADEDDGRAVLSITNGEIAEAHPNEAILGHLRRKFLLDELAS